MLSAPVGLAAWPSTALGRRTPFSAAQALRPKPDTTEEQKSLRMPSPSDEFQRWQSHAISKLFLHPFTFPSRLSVSYAAVCHLMAYTAPLHFDREPQAARRRYCDRLADSFPAISSHLSGQDRPSEPFVWSCQAQRSCKDLATGQDVEHSLGLTQPVLHAIHSGSPTGHEHWSCGPPEALAELKSGLECL